MNADVLLPSTNHGRRNNHFNLKAAMVFIFVSRKQHIDKHSLNGYSRLIIIFRLAVKSNTYNEANVPGILCEKKKSKTKLNYLTIFKPPIRIEPTIFRLLVL